MVCLDYNRNENTYKVYDEKLGKVVIIDKKAYLRYKLVNSTDNLFADEECITVVLKRPVNSSQVTCVTITSNSFDVIHINLSDIDMSILVTNNFKRYHSIINYTSCNCSECRCSKKIEFTLVDSELQKCPDKYVNDSHLVKNDSCNSLFIENDDFSYECLFMERTNGQLSIKFKYKHLGFIPFTLGIFPSYGTNTANGHSSLWRVDIGYYHFNFKPYLVYSDFEKECDNNEI